MIVSIPFKRESASQVTTMKFTPLPSNGKVYLKFLMNTRKKHRRFRFHSLQTGKRIQRNHNFTLNPPRRDPRTDVSIPFKRESGSKAVIITRMLETEKARISEMFPFPSNGKADPKLLPEKIALHLKMCFHSLQTGKRITRQELLW